MSDGSKPRIANVELLDALGRGAHSVVFRARREGRLYAVKVPRASKDGVVRRFFREAVALARVRHPALPVVMEVGQSEGIPYIVMELAPGETLAERLAAGPLGERDVVLIARRLAGALSAIHASGLVHRDVKPRNILIERLSGGVKLVDFGLAASPDAVVGVARAGTPLYAAPEQASELAYRIDGRADLYSLGCVLYECLTGTRPDAPSPGAASAVADGWGIAADAPASPGLSAVVEKLLALDPDDRYQSAWSLLRDLDDLDELSRSAAEGAPVRVGERDGVEPTGLPLFGRVGELARMGARWGDARAGKGGALLLLGAAGGGKSHLGEQFVGGVRGEGSAVFRAVCQPWDPMPFSAVGQMLESYFAACGDRARAADEVRRSAGDLAPLVKGLSPSMRRVFHDAPDVPRSRDAQRVFVEGVAEFFAQLTARVGPSLVYVDDVQWLDAGSRSVLRSAADRAGNEPVLYLFLARNDEASLSAVRRLTDALPPESFESLDLGPLDRAAFEAMIAAYLGADRVEDELVATVKGLSDGTPLGALEVLRTMLDRTLLAPHWGAWKLDSGGVAGMPLGNATLDLIRRRVEHLGPLTKETLSAAAVLGPHFEDRVLPAVTALDAEAVRTALGEARRALLVQAGRPGTHRFVHHCVSEAVLSELDRDAVRGLHQRAAEALDARVSARRAPGAADALDAETLYALAMHYAEGEPGASPRRVFETNVAAGRAAFDGFENGRAVEFFETALRAAERPGTELLFVIGEAYVRTGSLERALGYLRRVVAETDDRLLRARAYARIAWVYELQFDFRPSWAALRDAFDALGERVPDETPRSVTTAVGALVRRAWPRPRRAPPGAPERRLEALCGLYNQASRLALESGRLMPLVGSVVRGLEAAEQLGPSPPLARSYLLCSFLMTVFGRKQLGRTYLERARTIADAINDPTAITYYWQVRAAIACWAGDVQDSLDSGARCVTEYGHWQEFGEHCLSCYNQQFLESLRGHCLVAWGWIERALRAVDRRDHELLVNEFVELGSYAALCAIGRESQADVLLRGVREVTCRVPADSGFYPVVLGLRLRGYAERGDFGPGFEAVVDEFGARGFDPKRVHLGATEYYVHLGHARAHACLRAGKAFGPELERLREAVTLLKAAARIPLLEAHALSVAGYEAALSGREGEAGDLFSRAETLGHRERAPWVHYAVQRGRAHLHLRAGRAQLAHEYARLAETLAKEHGAAYRLRWVREEFDLRRTSRPENRSPSASTLPPPLVTNDRNSSYPSRAESRAGVHLRALLNVSRATMRELDPAYQARSVLDETVRAIGANRGFLFLVDQALLGPADDGPPSSIPPGVNRLRRVAARDAEGRDLDENEPYKRVLVEEVFNGGEMQSIETHGDGDGAPPGSAIAVPLVVYDRTAGVAYFDYRVSPGVFSDEDAELLVALVNQIPVALELARALRERERLAEDLRQAQKMEAVGLLAGGVAHDFNNMLAAIAASVDAILASVPRGDTLDDLKTIQSATERAAALTRQLLAFSRRQVLEPRVVSLNDVVTEVSPMVRRLVGSKVKLRPLFDPHLRPIKVDPRQLEHVIINLAVNARDAMPQGGTLTFTTENVPDDDPGLAAAAGAPQARPFVTLAVSDTGTGMDAPTRARIFEPFFTTKRAERGTGLGLATVYGIVRQSDGFIDVVSAPGEGTTFRIYLPITTEPPLLVAKVANEARPQTSATVLLVEDEPLVRQTMDRLLRRLGYAVITAPGGAEVLDLASRGALAAIDLVITDVMMPGLNGPDLVRKLASLGVETKVLYISGYTDGAFLDDTFGKGTSFLQKPISADVLAGRVRELLAQ